MLPKTFVEKRVIRSASCDLTDTWRPSAILEVMQDAAASHCVTLQIGRPDLLPRNLAWVITRSEVVMERLPSAGETITVTSVPMPMRRLFFPRHYLFHDEAGNQIGMANTLWVLLDLQARRIAKPDTYVMEHLPDNSDLTAPMGMPGATLSLDTEAAEKLLTPQYTDVDANLHANNTRYLDWCCNALGIQTMQENALMHFIVNYNTEIRPGTEIRTVLQRKDNAFAYSGYAADGTCHFSISGELQPRNTKR